MNDFTERWLQKERDLGLEKISDGFVVNGPLVLPASAAPCIEFEELKTMPRVQEVFKLEDWPVAALEKLEPYRMIGSDGAGNPICIEQQSGQVWLLDHDDHFQSKQFVNSSIPQLAESLLAYFGETVSDKLVAAIVALDPGAMSEGAFWWHEAKVL